MMLRPALNEMMEGGQDCYSFVVMIAKRARQIASKAEENHEILEEKPVQIAVNEVMKELQCHPAHRS